MARAVSTFLMFDGAAEEAMNLYLTLFPDSTLRNLERYGPGEEGPEGSLKRAEFTLGGHRLTCFNSPVTHAFTFTPAISLFIDCSDEAELNAAYAQLSRGGAVLMPLDNYGFSQKFVWLNDRWGVSWQLNMP
jgi:predicted 3-demethylubiquinone-9 3-methyltransferase (glyoxalase superfamily)